MSIKPSNIGAPDKGNIKQKPDATKLIVDIMELFVKFGNYRQFLMNFNKSLL